MKRLLPMAAGLLLLSLLIFTACTEDAPADTTAPSAPDLTTDAPTDATVDNATNDSTEVPTEALTDEVTTEAPTEPFTPPTADPTEAAAAGLPLDGDSYTVGGENPAIAPKLQYDYLKTYAHAYAGKSFTIYGNLAQNADGYLVLSLSDGVELVTYFSGVTQPTVGTYVKVTATFTQTVDMGDYVDFSCFTMMVTACEVLGEAKGPNGGKLMYITASSLNVRTSSDTSSSANIIGSYSKGDLVEVFEQDANGWYRVNYNGQTAYISNKYVSETKP